MPSSSRRPLGCRHLQHKCGVIARGHRADQSSSSLVIYLAAPSSAARIHAALAAALVCDPMPTFYRYAERLRQHKYEFTSRLFINKEKTIVIADMGKNKMVLLTLRRNESLSPSPKLPFEEERRYSPRCRRR